MLTPMILTPRLENSSALSCRPQAWAVHPPVFALGKKNTSVIPCFKRAVTSNGLFSESMLVTAGTFSPGSNGSAVAAEMEIIATRIAKLKNFFMNPSKRRNGHARKPEIGIWRSLGVTPTKTMRLIAIRQFVRWRSDRRAERVIIRGKGLTRGASSTRRSIIN